LLPKTYNIANRTIIYWQKRLSTTLQKYNAKALHLASNKIARANGLMRDGDVELNDIVVNERHIHNM
jgi:hypothetical protein